MVKLSGALKVLLLFTVGVSILFSYTVYLWVGVASALRKVDVGIQQIDFGTQGQISTINVSAVVSNPSGFGAWIPFIAIKAYQTDGHWGALDVNTHPGSFRFLRPPREVRMGLNQSVSFSFHVSDDLSSLGGDAEWQLAIRVHLLTVFSLEIGNVVELNLQRSYFPTQAS
jgi:hypothetical protein